MFWWRGVGYDVAMEFTEYMLWKAIAIVVLAFAYGVWRGATGRSGQGRRERRD